MKNSPTPEGPNVDAGRASTRPEQNGREENTQQQEQAESAPVAAESREVQTRTEKAEAIEADREIDPEAEIGEINTLYDEASAKIAKLRETMDQRKAEADKLRESMGAPKSESDEDYPEKKQIEALQERLEELEEKKEEAEEKEQLKIVFVTIQQMSPAERQSVMQTGQMPDGKPFTTKDGKQLQPEVAKSLAQAIENGATKLTVGVLKLVLAVVKGVIKGIFKVVKATAESLGGSK